jgi:hypothetical protein
MDMTNNKQQTAVEWFANQLSFTQRAIYNGVIEQAKEMQKQQTIEFAAEYTYGTKRVGAPLKEDFIKLYEQTYGGGDQ